MKQFFELKKIIKVKVLLKLPGSHVMRGFLSA